MATIGGPKWSPDLRWTNQCSFPETLEVELRAVACPQVPEANLGRVVVPHPPVGVRCTDRKQQKWATEAGPAGPARRSKGLEQEHR